MYFEIINQVSRQVLSRIDTEIFDKLYKMQCGSLNMKIMDHVRDPILEQVVTRGMKLIKQHVAETIK